MTPIELEIQAIAVVVAVACALPGVFLVLRRMALMSDAISHTVLLGIVLAFFVTRSLASPLLIFGAAATGVLTVVLAAGVVAIAGTERISRGASIMQQKTSVAQRALERIANSGRAVVVKEMVAIYPVLRSRVHLEEVKQAVLLRLRQPQDLLDELGKSARPVRGPVLLGKGDQTLYKVAMPFSLVRPVRHT